MNFFRWSRGKKLLVAAAVIVPFYFVGMVAHLVTVEGRGMEPRLKDGSRVLVNRLAYRWSTPKRGDVVVIYHPPAPDKSFARRVVAEPGDVVRIVDGRVFVNDVPTSSTVTPATSPRSHDTWGAQTIREGYAFVTADAASEDPGNLSWALLPQRYIVGRVMFGL